MEYQKLTDEKLVEIIREEDRELYIEIIGRYKSKLSRYLKKFISNSDELDDVLQVVFIKAYKNLYGFNINQKFSSWIYRIAHNEAINQVKSNFRHIALDDVEYKIIDENIDIGGQIDKDILRKKINEGFDKLDLKYKEVLLLFYSEQKSYEEISEILRIPKNTVGVLISRGKKYLREILESDFKNHYG